MKEMCMFANNRDGTFSEVSGAVGLDFPEDSRSFVLADLDHDGRLEVILKNRNAPQLRILHNAMKDLGHSIAFRLRGHKAIAMPSEQRSRSKRERYARRSICRQVRGFLPSTPKRCFSALESRKERFEPQFAGRAGSLRNSKISRSIIGSKLRKAPLLLSPSHSPRHLCLCTSRTTASS